MNSRFSSIEALEARIAPALAITNAIPNLVAGVGVTTVNIDLSHLSTAVTSNAYHTIVSIQTNYDADPTVAGIQASAPIVIELFDDVAPLTVQNFLRYLTNPDTSNDFTNTFFHRAVDGFVLQGGGYDASTIHAALDSSTGTIVQTASHIATFPAVHNEYNLSNVAGTLAMAKVSGDPNSATNEWFFNLVDNDGSGATNNLNASNGGFTVFAKVISGFDEVVQKIVDLPTASLTSGPAPVQNFTSGTPTADQVVRITGYTIQPHKAVDTGVTYELVTSTGDFGVINKDNLTTSAVEKVVTGASVNNSTLNLKFDAVNGGTATVTIKVSNGTDAPVYDTFNVTVLPNILAKANGATDVIIPSKNETVGVQIFNNGGAAMKGLFDVTVKLVKLVNGTDEDGSAIKVPASPEVVSTSKTFTTSLNLASGAGVSLPTTLVVPPTLATSDDDYYRVVVEVTPHPDSGPELFTDDNISKLGSDHQLLNLFGTFGGVNYTLKYVAQDQPGKPLVTWSMTGGGTGQISADGKTLTGSNTNATTTVSVSGVGVQHLILAGLNFDSLVGNVNLGNVDIVGGPLIFGGGVKSLTLGDVTGQSLMLLGAVLPENNVKANLTLGKVKDFSIESQMPVGTLSVKEWKDASGATDTITAPSIDNLKSRGSAASRGDFEADVTIQSTTPVAAINVAGTLHNSIIESAGNIGAITVGAINGSKIYLGTSGLTPALEDISVSDFTDTATLGSFSVVGNKAFAPATRLFVDSQIAASTIGAIKVFQVETSNPSEEVGFVADIIRSYTRVGFAPVVNVLEPKTVEDVEDYLVKVL